MKVNAPEIVLLEGENDLGEDGRVEELSKHLPEVHWVLCLCDMGGKMDACGMNGGQIERWMDE